MGRDRTKGRLTSRPACFNPRARVGRDSGKRPHQPRRHVFQSTRPRGARLRRKQVQAHQGMVSIHAPAWGATSSGNVEQITIEVSIHAPAWGATRALAITLSSRAEFQSTRPRGARPPPRKRLRKASSFNPRARVGRDSPSTAKKCGLHTFQSTRPRGARHQDDAAKQHQQVSIHAPAWGATQRAVEIQVKRIVSIHAPAWGATPPCRNSHKSIRGFNPRARVGRDKVFSKIQQKIEFVSIHAPAWGATYWSCAR